MKMKYGPEAHVYEQRVVTEGGILGTGLLANKYVEIDVAIPEKASTKDRVDKKLQDLRALLLQRNQEPNPNNLEQSGIVSGSETVSRNKQSLRARRSLEDLPRFSERIAADTKVRSGWVGQSSKSDWESPESDFDREESDSLEPSLSQYTETEADHQGSPEIYGPGLSFTGVLSKDSGKTERLGKDSQMNPSLEKFGNKLVEEGISSQYVSELLGELHLHLSPLDRGRLGAISEKAVELLESRIRVDEDLFSGKQKGKRKVIFLVGPTGSGKTTTVAKLAAKYFLHMGRTVSLYTTDNYRIAAVEQLKRYADTMELPFFAVKDIRKFQEALKRDGSELILVDTAGYSHKDKDLVPRLQEFYRALDPNDQLENILVLSTTVSRHNADQVISAYEGLDFRRIILTKIDETDYLGSFLELADTRGKEFAYFSVGQDVPFDILGAEKKLLAECVVYPEKMKGMKGEVFSAKS